VKTKKAKVKHKSTVQKNLESISTQIKTKLEQSPLPFSIGLFVGAGILISVVGVYFAWQKYVVQERRAQMEAFADHNSRIAAANVSNYIHGINQRLVVFCQK